ncbi:MAG: HAD family hydrolase [Alkalinema sp. RU_4_3]|nr:HAD family hydrolase [Alkalinema sp. RU_4_3]
MHPDIQLRCGDRTFPQIQAIVFDKDGTLGRSEAFLLKLVDQRLACLVEQFGPIDKAPLRRSWGLTPFGGLSPLGLMAVGSRRDNEIATAAFLAGERPWMATVEQVSAAFQSASDAFPERGPLTPLQEGIRPLLERLETTGIKLAIVSADRTENVIEFAQWHRIDHHFDLLLGAQPDLPKPDGRLLEMVCCDRLGVLPRHTLVIGDSSADINLALNGGAAGAIGVTWCWPEAYELPGADVMLDRVEDIEVLT